MLEHTSVTLAKSDLPIEEKHARFQKMLWTITCQDMPRKAETLTIERHENTELGTTEIALLNVYDIEGNEIDNLFELGSFPVGDAWDQWIDGTTLMIQRFLDDQWAVPPLVASRA